MPQGRKLTDRQEFRIVERLLRGVAVTVIARVEKVSRATVHKVKRRWSLFFWRKK